MRKVTVQPQDRGRGREKVQDEYSSNLGQRNRKRGGEDSHSQTPGLRNRKKGTEGKLPFNRRTEKTEKEEMRTVTVQLQDRGIGREKVKEGYSLTPGQRNRKRETEGWIQFNPRTEEQEERKRKRQSNPRTM